MTVAVYTNNLPILQLTINHNQLTKICFAQNVELRIPKQENFAEAAELI